MENQVIEKALSFLDVTGQMVRVIEDFIKSNGVTPNVVNVRVKPNPLLQKEDIPSKLIIGKMPEMLKDEKELIYASSVCEAVAMCDPTYADFYITKVDSAEVVSLGLDISVREILKDMEYHRLTDKYYKTTDSRYKFWIHVFDNGKFIVFVKGSKNDYSLYTQNVNGILKDVTDAVEGDFIN